MAKITVRAVKARLEDGSLRPGASYGGMATLEIAREYLRRCKEAGVCAGCYNDLDDDDRAINGQDTNQCVACACR